MQLFSTFPFIKSLATIVSVLALASIVNKLLQHLVRVPKKLDTRRARTYLSIMRSGISLAVFGTSLYFIFLALQIDVTPLIASAGVAGLAIGFGARSLIEDLIAGLFLLTQDTLSIGDYVKAAGAEGVVENISFKTIQIRDKDGALHVIPNGQVKTVVNLSKGRARVTINLPVKADQDIDLIIKVLKNVLKSMRKEEKFAKHVLPNSGVRGIEDIKPGNRLFIRVVIITRPAKRWKIARHFRYLVKKGFEENNLSFA